MKNKNVIKYSYNGVVFSEIIPPKDYAEQYDRQNGGYLSKYAQNIMIVVFVIAVIISIYIIVWR